MLLKHDMKREEQGNFGKIRRALVTTDIVGSTPLVCRLGDEGYQEVIELHDHLLIEQVREHDGEYVRSQGDGALVAFADAQDALAWSHTVQRELRRAVGVRIRIGAHFGAVRARRSGYVGKSLHVVARITALAGADEILASRPFLVAAGEPPVGKTYPVQLRGLDEVTEIASIHGGGVDPAFPEALA